MRPRTKLQVRVFALSQSLPKITEEQQQWAFKNMLNHVAYRTKTKTACLDCGHTWASKDNTLLISKLLDTHVSCPACGVRLTIEDTRKKLMHQKHRHMTILDVREEFQVVRIFELWSNHKAGQVASFHIWEVIQQFIIPNGKMEIVARNTGWSGYYNGDLECRPNKGWHYKYDIWSEAMFPKIKVQPIYKRNGLTVKIDGISAYQLLKMLLFDSKTETLLKAKQHSLLAARINNDRSGQVQRFWDSIKIVMRTKYRIKVNEVITWLDYLDLLDYFKKDLRNPVYICPKDLKAEHNKLVAKKQAILNHERAWRKYTELMEYFGDPVNQVLYRKPVPLQLEINRLQAHKDELERQYKAKSKKEKIAFDQAHYIKTHGVFFGMAFMSDNITIEVLKSVDEFFKESEVLKHCVFSNAYYKKDNSLVLSARINGVPVETIEVSLTDMKILQARGLNNQPSQFNKQIVELVSKNLPKIRKKYKELKSVAA